MSSEAAPVVADATAPEGMYYRVAGNDGVEFKVNELAIQQSETLNRPVTTMSHTAEDVEKKDAIPIGNIDDEPFLNLVLPEYDTKSYIKEFINEVISKLIESASKEKLPATFDIRTNEEDEAAEKDTQEKTANEAAEKDVQGTSDSA
ncbi:hypothetical protein CAEBREN_02780 [Caenorhabditis brenneri]|uniref:Uncharacterized protein n=1 Tax=Caenorhabditis brenneri TaxID=135651 RepID=G0P637_CAEBE|nr:hypothetical protein CAEBREN_02780 [Caenorhabditis brenneri]